MSCCGALSFTGVIFSTQTVMEISVKELLNHHFNLPWLNMKINSWKCILQLTGNDSMKTQKSHMHKVKLTGAEETCSLMITVPVTITLENVNDGDQVNEENSQIKEKHTKVSLQFSTWFDFAQISGSLQSVHWLPHAQRDNQRVYQTKLCQSLLQRSEMNSENSSPEMKYDHTFETQCQLSRFLLHLQTDKLSCLTSQVLPVSTPLSGCTVWQCKCCPKCVYHKYSHNTSMHWNMLPLYKLFWTAKGVQLSSCALCSPSLMRSWLVRCSNENLSMHRLYLIIHTKGVHGLHSGSPKDCFSWQRPLINVSRVSMMPWGTQLLNRVPCVCQLRVEFWMEYLYLVAR